MAARALFNILPLALSAAASTLYSTYSFDPLRHLGGIAPYLESQDPPASPDAPQGCSAERAAYLVRHAAIYANDFDYEEYIEPLVEKLRSNKTSVDWTKVPHLNFLADWEAPISEAEAEILTRVGRLEATRLGVDLDFRYPNLRVPRRVWTSSAERTYKSAQSLVRGLEQNDDESTIDIVSVSESDDTGADSLTPYKACPGYEGSTGAEESSAYRDVYAAPVAARLNDLAPAGFEFSVDDVFGMQQLCGYETVIRGRSPFCSLDLFAPDDWLGWEYAEDVRYHYNAGYGSGVAGHVGMPWLNATADLLLDNGGGDGGDVHEDGNGNGNGNGAQDLYVSFTHRELPPMVVVAMGLFNNSQFGGNGNGNVNVNDTMPLDRINYRRDWKSSHILPFLGNIAIERFGCSGSYGYDDGEYYRVLVNGAPQALPGCADGPGTSCSRGAFRDYVRDRVGMFAGFSDKCGVEGGGGGGSEVVSFYNTEGNDTEVQRRYRSRF